MPDDKKNRSDKFTMQYGTVTEPLCMKCKHRDSNPLTCKAFPKGIPVKILTGELDHHKAVAGDHGIQFEPK